MQWCSALREERDPIKVQSTFVQLYKSSSFVADHFRWKRPLSSCYVLSRQSSAFLTLEHITTIPPPKRSSMPLLRETVKTLYGANIMVTLVLA